jgi:hypothetical protein
MSFRRSSAARARARASCARIESFCFSGGEAIHAKGREGRTGGTAKRADKVDARRPETRRAGLVWAKSFGLRLDRATSTVFAESLDLDPNHRRQNGSIQVQLALEHSSDPSTLPHRDYRALPGRRCIFHRVGGGLAQSGPIGPERTAPRSCFRWCQVIVSIAFSWRSGPTGPIGPGLPQDALSRSSCIFRMSHRCSADKHAVAVAIPSAFAVSTISKSGPGDCSKPHRSSAPTLAPKPPGRLRVLCRYQA